MAFIFRSNISITKRQLVTPPTTFEYLFGFVQSAKNNFLLLGVYRPGSQPVSLFFEEFSAVLEELCVHQCPVIICGDFNIHVDDATNSVALRFLDLLDSFGRTQHVSSPTHSTGHILDLVITSSSNAINNVSVGDFLSDHALVMFDIDISKPHTQSI